MNEEASQLAPATAEPELGTEPPARGSRFARLHTQTYEMELLVSGGFTLALMQLQEPLSTRLEHSLAFVDGGLRMVVSFGLIYAALAVLTLTVFFACNLLLRAFWIGLVGLESVFPEGIDWDQLKVGPHSKQVLLRQVPPLSRSIESVDDICSLIFSVAFVVAMLFVYSIAMALIFLGLGWLAAVLVGVTVETGFWTVLSLFFLLTLGGALLDRYLAPRLDPEKKPYRFIGQLVRAGQKVSILGWIAPVLLVLQTRLNERRSNVLIIGSMLTLTVFFMGSLLVREGLLGFSSLVYLPEEKGADFFDAKLYRETWGPEDFDIATRQPSIASDVVNEPYVKLLLPYRPRTHNARMAKTCPNLAPLRQDGFQLRPRDAGPKPEDPATRQSLDCFVGLFVIHLDGKPLEGERWDWFTEPKHQVPGAITYLDVRNLPPGRHQIEIEAPSPKPPKPGEEEKRQRFLIPFWL